MQPNHPISAADWCNQGVWFQTRGELRLACAAYLRAIRMEPKLAAAHFNRGTALAALGDIDKAIASYRAAIRADATLAQAWNNLGNILQGRGELDSAVLHFRTALELKPDYVEAWNNLGTAYRDRGEIDQALKCFGTALKFDPTHAAVDSNRVYALHFHPGYGASALKDECLGWARRHTRLAIERKFANSRDPNRRLRIGYVSPDFRRHSAACFLRPLLRNHTPQNVETIAYSCVRGPDALTGQFREMVDIWRDGSRFSDNDLLHAILGDEVDILVDLSLHMAGNRLKVFAQRAAPVQLSWLAYPGTSGLAEMDYRFTDHRLDPPGNDEHYCEESVRLPNSFWCYEPLISPLPAIGPLPALRNGYITFGCLNNFAKAATPALQLWASVTKLIAGSKLLIQAPQGSARECVTAMLSKQGMAGDSIQFVERCEPESYFALYSGIDIALDTTPYTGHTTTFDALSMGVPTITLVGETAVSRGSASILAALGLDNCIADSAQQYVQAARTIASDLNVLSTLRGSLRERIFRSPLTDGKRFAADVEDAYRRWWQRWCVNHEKITG